jgi:glycosyltransferase involved in cell wall biosynthesis
MRICQLCAVDFTVEKFLTPLIDEMTNEGWDVVTVCSDGNLVKNLRDKGYYIHTIPISRSINLFKAVRTIILLCIFFRKNKFDIIHVHTPIASFLARIAAKITCKSYIIYTAHGFYFHENMNYIKKNFYIILEKIAGNFTNLLFCQSQEDAIDAVRYSILKKNNIISIGNGVNIANFDFIKYQSYYKIIRDEFNIPFNAKVIGIVARMVREKGYKEFLTSAINLSNIHTDVYFLLIGEKLESDYDQSINDYLNKAKSILGNKLIDLGLRSDVARLISIMDIFCLPSYREGMPRTIIEAMFLKKPIVATNIRGCREEVVHNKTGLLVSPQNHEELTNALNYLLLNLDIAKQMGENGYKIAKKIYDEKIIIKLQIDVIKERFYKIKYF